MPAVSAVTRELYDDSRARLIELAGGIAGAAHVIRPDGATIGRDRGADIIVDATHISRMHARISRDDKARWVIVDLNSRNGTYVNGLPIKTQVLDFGDQVKLGQTQLVFCRHDPFEAQLLEAQKLESVGRLAGGVAHDFNNMLAVIVANVQYMQAVTADAAGLDSQVGACLEEALDAANRARKLTRQLLRFARHGEGDHEMLDVGRLVTDLLPLCARTLPATITIEPRVASDLTVSGDESQLTAALMNLCVNARDAIGDDEGRIEIVASRYTHGAESALALPTLRAGRYVRVSVSDGGCGMSDATRARIFEPFFTTKGEGGTGLGLASAYGSVRKHGGDIHVESALGVGTTVTIYLPASSEQQCERSSVRIHRPTPSATVGSGSILVVDDERGARSSVGRLLGLLGHQHVIYASDGLEAIAAFETHRADIGLVLLDIHMPKLDGAGTFARLKQIRPSLPVWLVTGGNADDAVVPLREGAGGLLRKPFTLDELKSAVATAVLPT